MKKTGYVLVDATGTVLRNYAGTHAGVCLDIPARINLPNGDIVEGPSAGETWGSWTLVECWMDDSPSPLHEEVSRRSSYTGGRLEITRAWTFPRSSAVAAIKAEAGRRIAARYPQWKQANMQARQSELLAIQAGLTIDAEGARIEARELTDDEAAEQRAIGQAWEWIKAVRSSSDAIEALDSIPDDYASDSRWPE